MGFPASPCLLFYAVCLFVLSSIRVRASPVASTTEGTDHTALQVSKGPKGWTDLPRTVQVGSRSPRSADAQCTLLELNRHRKVACSCVMSSSRPELSPGVILTPGDTGPCLGTSMVIMTRGILSSSEWGQGCCSTPHSALDSDTENDPALDVSSAEGRTVF